MPPELRRNQSCSSPRGRNLVAQYPRRSSKRSGSRMEDPASKEIGLTHGLLQISGGVEIQARARERVSWMGAEKDREMREVSRVVMERKRTGLEKSENRDSGDHPALLPIATPRRPSQVLPTELTLASASRRSWNLVHVNILIPTPSPVDRGRKKLTDRGGEGDE
ncbi:hypothetical protein TIFTF001_013001 [Ficus carica]|uniref:Uncharacterized protein n=1 Tax=Ficus carica TaxID=3494 RepID=A0AA88AH03_FICCA|nr:hypothetical protein TIFTF001_013001 [Ficus carica]